MGGCIRRKRSYYDLYCDSLMGKNREDGDKAKSDLGSAFLVSLVTLFTRCRDINWGHVFVHV